MGPRGVMGQVPPSGGHIGSQSGLSGLPKTSRTTPLTSTLSSPSRSSPIMGLPISQPPSQPIPSQQQRYNFGRYIFKIIIQGIIFKGELQGVSMFNSTSGSRIQELNCYISGKLAFEAD